MLDDLQRTAVRKAPFEERMQLLEREVEWCKTANDRLATKCKSIENYLQVYSPVQMRLYIDQRLTQVIGDRKKYARRIKETMKNYQDELEAKIAACREIEFAPTYVEPPTVMPEVESEDAASDSSYSHIKGIVQELLNDAAIEIPAN